MKLSKILTVHLLWLSVLAQPVLAQTRLQQHTLPLFSDASPVPSYTAIPDMAELPSVRTLQAIPADTVYPGQKKPFTKSQLLEGSNKRYLTRAVLPAAALIGAGVYTMQGNGFYSSHDARDLRHKTIPNFSTKVDDYLMFLPIAYMYGFNAFSSQNRHEMPRQTALLLASGVLTSAIVWPAKRWTNMERPNGEKHAFPSGHTAYAFTIATVVDKEFRHKSPWISVGSYTLAGATGALRVMNNKHWMADVLAGAGVGILSTNTVYWLHDKLFQNKGYNTMVVPVVLPSGQPGMGLSVTF
ncbi:phosphatase PAP2 family protein [Pontibacter sp. JH31]|uniref:Phosphatase PAP2 family protein n=1 Tax=Pontibacter aquaedesilientis TaxID=2766980 RepID=A0ABR7XHX7_9BACT|nr:phosphatase PAP2 family protein [Pontibacter aquaedesilientis]MBD1397243.1 phosphatase PAP2 family protein [Pontibacter aquaedesilientis]